MRASPATTTPSTRMAPKRSPTSTARATFMAKFDEREGNSCHIHISLRGDDGAAVFADADDELGMSPMFRSFIAGQLATLRELTLFYAPNINSYKRFALGSFAPTA